MLYRSKKNGSLIQTECVLKSEFWELVGEEKPATPISSETPKPKRTRKKKKEGC